MAVANWASLIFNRNFWFACPQDCPKKSTGYDQKGEAKEGEITTKIIVNTSLHLFVDLIRSGLLFKSVLFVLKTTAINIYSIYKKTLTLT